MAQVQILMNPARMKLGRGKAIRLSQAGGHPKGEVHIKRPDANYALCGAGSPSSYKSAKTRRKVIAAGTRVVTCYRCIKLYRMNQGHTEDQLLRFPANKQVHHLISGGREGARVSKSKPYTRKVKAERLLEGFGRFTTSQSGAQTRGPKSHPTQTRMLPEAAKAWRRTRAGGAQLKLIANPRFFGMGYAKGIKDYRSAVPTPATTLKQRSMSYQRGYLEGYADTADKKAARANPKNKNPTYSTEKTRHWEGVEYVTFYNEDSASPFAWTAWALGFGNLASGRSEAEVVEGARDIISVGYKTIERRQRGGGYKNEKLYISADEQAAYKRRRSNPTRRKNSRSQRKALGKRMYLQISPSVARKATWGSGNERKYNEKLADLAGQIVEVDTKHLFEDQYNLKDHDVRVFDRDVVEVINDQRKGMQKSHWSGKWGPARGKGADDFVFAEIDAMAGSKYAKPEDIYAMQTGRMRKKFKAPKKSPVPAYMRGWTATKVAKVFKNGNVLLDNGTRLVKAISKVAPIAKPRIGQKVYRNSGGTHFWAVTGDMWGEPMRWIVKVPRSGEGDYRSVTPISRATGISEKKLLSMSIPQFVFAASKARL